MRQLIFDKKFNEGERCIDEREFLIVENEEIAKHIADKHSSPETLIYLGGEYVDALELIGYGNYSSGMKKVIERRYEISFDDVIDFLKDHRLIIYQGRNWMDDFKSDFYILSMRGLEIVAKHHESLEDQE